MTMNTSINQIVILVGPQLEEQVARAVPNTDRKLVSVPRELTTGSEVVLIATDDEIIQRDSEGIKGVLDPRIGVLTNLGVRSGDHTEGSQLVQEIFLALGERLSVDGGLVHGDDSSRLFGKYKSFVVKNL